MSFWSLVQSRFKPTQLEPSQKTAMDAEQVDAQKQMAIWGANDTAQTVTLGMIKQIETNHLSRLEAGIEGARLLELEPSFLMQKYEEQMAENYPLAEAAIRRALEGHSKRFEQWGMLPELEDIVLRWTITFRETLREKARRIVDAGFAA